MSFGSIFPTEKRHRNLFSKDNFLEGASSTAGYMFVFGMYSITFVWVRPCLSCRGLGFDVCFSGRTGARGGRETPAAALAWAQGRSDGIIRRSSRSFVLVVPSHLVALCWQGIDGFHWGFVPFPRETQSALFVLTDAPHDEAPKPKKDKPATPPKKKKKQIKKKQKKKNKNAAAPFPSPRFRAKPDRPRVQIPNPSHRLGVGLLNCRIPHGPWATYLTPRFRTSKAHLAVLGPPPKTRTNTQKSKPAIAVFCPPPPNPHPHFSGEPAPRAGAARLFARKVGPRPRAPGGTARRCTSAPSAGSRWSAASGASWRRWRYSDPEISPGVFWVTKRKPHMCVCAALCCFFSFFVGCVCLFWLFLFLFLLFFLSFSLALLSHASSRSLARQPSRFRGRPTSDHRLGPPQQLEQGHLWIFETREHFWEPRRQGSSGGKM